MPQYSEQGRRPKTKDLGFILLSKKRATTPLLGKSEQEGYSLDAEPTLIPSMFLPLVHNRVGPKGGGALWIMNIYLLIRFYNHLGQLGNCCGPAILIFCSAFSLSP